MVWFGGDPDTNEAYGGSRTPLQDAHDKASGQAAKNAIAKDQASGNGSGKNR